MVFPIRSLHCNFHRVSIWASERARMCILYAENACCVLVFFDFCAHHLMTLYTLSLYTSNNDSKLDDLGDTFKCIISAHTHTHTLHILPLHNDGNTRTQCEIDTWPSFVSSDYLEFAMHFLSTKRVRLHLKRIWTNSITPSLSPLTLVFGCCWLTDIFRCRCVLWWGLFLSFQSFGWKTSIALETFGLGRHTVFCCVCVCGEDVQILCFWIIKIAFCHFRYLFGAGWNGALLEPSFIWRIYIMYRVELFKNRLMLIINLLTFHTLFVVQKSARGM